MTRDLRTDDRVWLVPRTLAAPAICYRRPRALVDRVEGVYVVVLVDGQRHRVHADNVTRADPGRARDRAATPRPAPSWDGYEEVPLFEGGGSVPVSGTVDHRTTTINDYRGEAA